MCLVIFAARTRFIEAAARFDESQKRPIDRATGAIVTRLEENRFAEENPLSFAFGFHPPPPYRPIFEKTPPSTRSTAPSFLVCPPPLLSYSPSKPFFQTCLFPRTIEDRVRLSSFSGISAKYTRNNTHLFRIYRFIGRIYELEKLAFADNLSQHLVSPMQQLLREYFPTKVLLKPPLGFRWKRGWNK